MEGSVPSARVPPLPRSKSTPCENRLSEDRRGIEASQSASTTGDNEDKLLLDALNRATKYRFCPNRTWAVAQSLPNGKWDLPDLLPFNDEALESMLNHNTDHGIFQVSKEMDRHHHVQCTFDICELSEVNFTSVPQRHESPSCQPGRYCQPLESLFSRDILDKAVAQGRLTAWKLNGAATIDKGQRYMAISHVWSDGTGTGSWDGLKVNRCLYHFFRKIAREFECDGIWWDTICVPGKKELRAKALANMHNNYEKAEITFVHDCFLRNLPWTNAETACIAILMSPWFSRGWTALELAKSGGKVKVAFKGDGGPLIKDLEDDILEVGREVSVRHKLARNAILNLKESSIETVNDLLILLGSRHTSWGRDKAIISGLLVGADIEETGHQQVIYQAVLRKLKTICHANLFHNMPTISNGSSWSPIRLFDMPISPPNTHTRNKLKINEDGEVVGEWKELQLAIDLEKFYVWNGVHPLIEAKLRSCLKNQYDDHILLVEPGNDKVHRALLVRRLNKNDEKSRHQFVGSVYFHPCLNATGLRIIDVTIANSETTVVKTEDDYKDKSETFNGKLRKEHNHPSSSKKEGRAPMVGGCSLSHLAEIPTEIGISKNNELLESMNASHQTQCPIKKTTLSLTSGERLLSAAKNGKDEDVRQLIREGIDIGFQDNHRRTPTSWAAEGGHCGVIKLLLHQYEVRYDSMDSAMRPTRDTNPTADRVVDQFIKWYDSKDVDGRTPLLIALQEEKRDVAILLLNWYETHYMCEPQDEAGRTPLSWAASKGYKDVTRIIITKPNVLIDSMDNFGHTPLSYAAKNGHEDIVKVLIKTGKVDVNSKDRSGHTPLSHAAENGHETIVKFLVESGKADSNVTDSSGQTPLSYAAKNGHEAVVKFLVETGKADVNLTDSSGQTPLSYAADNGHKAVVKFLVATGKADVNLADNFERTPLSFAAENGHETVVQFLLENSKADVNLKNSSGRTPLSYAAENGHEAVVKILLEVGKADLNFTDSSGQTPLSYAAWNGHEAVVKFLLEIGKADINSQDGWGGTLLSGAAKNGHEAVVKFLVENGKANVNLRDGCERTPLSWAAENGYQAVVKFLVETGKADVNSKNRSGQTPLSYAAENGHATVVKFLVKAGNAEVNLTGSFGRTPLSYAAENGHAAIVKFLVEDGKADVNLRGSWEETPLSFAARSGHEVVVKFLLKTGKADVNTKNSCGMTPLSYAAENGHERVVKFLVETGKADVNLQGSFEKTPLSYAAENGHATVVKFLVETGKADVNLTDTFERSPLSDAAKNGHEAVVKFLVETGKADVNLRNRSGRTPLSYAAENGHETVVKFLVETGKADVNLKGEFERTALSYAAETGHEAIVQFLIDIVGRR